MQEMNNREWQIYAALFELLALSFRYPDLTLVDALVSGEYAEAAVEIAEALGLGFTDEVESILASYRGVDPDALRSTLRVEATRLFVGAPEPVISPYEGVWRAIDDGVQPLLFVNPHSMAVERFYRSCGVGQPEGKNEPLDHISTELEFLQYLCMLEAEMVEPNPNIELPEDGWASVLNRFLEEHALVWMPRFADATYEQSRVPFYQAAAQLLKASIA